MKSSRKLSTGDLLYIVAVVVISGLISDWLFPMPHIEVGRVYEGEDAKRLQWVDNARTWLAPVVLLAVAGVLYIVRRIIGSRSR